MNWLPAEIEAEQRQAQGRSSALSAAAALAQMDPHSREDLICYLQALTEAQAASDEEETRYLIKAIAEVFMIEDDAASPDLDAWEAEANRTPEGRNALQKNQKRSRSFLARYHELKAAAGLKTLRDVAKASGLSPTTVQAIETQSVKPQAKTIQALAKAFKVEVGRLLED